MTEKGYHRAVPDPHDQQFPVHRCMDVEEAEAFAAGKLPSRNRPLRLVDLLGHNTDRQSSRCWGVNGRPNRPRKKK